MLRERKKVIHCIVPQSDTDSSLLVWKACWVLTWRVTLSWYYGTDNVERIMKAIIVTITIIMFNDNIKDDFKRSFDLIYVTFGEIFLAEVNYL